MSRRTRFFWGIFLCCLIIQFYFIYWNSRKSFREFPNDENYFNETLAKLLVPRWAGSPGHIQVSDFLVKSLKKRGFHTVLDHFYDGIPFTNIVAIMNMEANNFLMLSCHYDSKFLNGSTNYLVFFDGHESFEDVNDDFNSLNGSRHFTEVELILMQSIEVVIAFNLIGAPNHIYMSHYERTYKLHTRMADIEQELRESGKLSNCHQLFHKLKDHESDIEDDHYPFLLKGVPALHIIPHTFPDVWHTESDTIQNLHFPTIRNMNLIVTRFVYKYLNDHVSDKDIESRFD
ncbi:glutaminyl-peptide cyclotransferase-like protein [Drosophila innubila]|uniref:glutaminyl-peptide cyclotransferase-like protein n=1 Tax=Drosophila innubila TaxID=198719 RepID=UPI00148D16E1|nr:glutaminyl-peptide cyclotransferase-like protein [Drosophila innubila]